MELIMLFDDLSCYIFAENWEMANDCCFKINQYKKAHPIKYAFISFFEFLK